MGVSRYLPARDGTQKFLQEPAKFGAEEKYLET